MPFTVTSYLPTRIAKRSKPHQNGVPTDSPDLSLRFGLCMITLPLFVFSPVTPIKDVIYHQHNRNKEPSLNDLNDDILLEIFAVLIQSSSANERKDRFYDNQQRQKTPLQKLSKVKDGEDFPLSLIPRPRLLGPLLALSMTNRRLRYLAGSAIYKSIRIGEDENWYDALRKLDSIAKCEAVRVHAKNFIMDLSIPRAPLEKLEECFNCKGLNPPGRLAPRLIDTLSSLSKLKNLSLIIPDHHTEIFRTTFEASSASFQSVRTLVLGPHMDWIIAKCPNVEVISSCGWRWLRSNVNGKDGQQHITDLIEAAGRAKHLRHFEMYDRWSDARVKAVYQSMTGIESLAMPGAHQQDSVETLLPILSRFRDLRTLALANAWDLGVGFNPPICGNVYFGPDGQRVREAVKRERVEAEKRVAQMAFTMLPKLEELWIGDSSRATVVRTDFDNELSWMETPRPKPYRDCWDLWED
ncbi:MAG: hypothetical protein Q9221_004625 [Calogaya cf. arnoldii]